MLDANMELERLKRTLENKGLDREVVEEVIGLAKEDISVAMAGILQEGLQEAIQAGDNLNADTFIAELTAINVGGHFEIDTFSGKTDFSEPPWPMLPSLLKNGKTAKDGSVYKVIPVAKKTEMKLPGPRATTVEAMKALDQAAVSSARGKQARKHGERTGSNSILEQSAKLAGFFNMANPNKPAKKNDNAKSKGEIEYRVATSKQDPMNKWVNPGKSQDLTEPLRKINSDIQSKLSDAIMNVIRKYEEMY